MPMKVTVCFDKVKILVPCGDGELLVRELIEKAIVRYKKARGKSTDYWVSVHILRTANEDSILDPDDTLIDVVDDKEQLLADFEEQGGPALHHNGDGQSVSSAGTTSPDIFQTEALQHKQHHRSRGYSFDSTNDVVVTETDISSGSGLTVRRGSEPTLNVLENGDGNNESKPTANGPLSPLSPDLDENLNQKKQNDNSFGKDGNHKPIIKGMPPSKEKTPPFSRFARDSWRQSLGNQPNMLKWFEAQEKQEEKQKLQIERQGPIGGAASPEQDHESTERLHKPRILPPVPPAKQREVGVLICLKNDGSPLGIHVVPNFSEDGRESGLLVQSIENGGKIDKDGRLKVHDRIIDINNHDLHGITFAKAQEIFRDSMKTDEIQLKVVKHSLSQAKKPPPPTVLPKPRGHSPIKRLFADSIDDQRPSLVKSTSIDKRAPPPAPPTRHPSTTLSASSSISGVNDTVSDTKIDTENGDGTSTPQTGTLTKNKEAIIAPTNTKKLGKRVDIELVKGRMGLGFSVTTRDNPTGGPSPIYIKNILPKGAAITDGRLCAGDRLLEVDGHEMTGKTQSEAVTILRNTSPGNPVKIVVSRQEVEGEEEEEEEPQDERFKVPRELPFDKSGDDGTLAIMKNKELIEFDIPLNDTGSAGLGVSVKGKTLTMEDGLTRDLGIFVKSVIHGGAASKDARLLVNDQLLEVNETPLVDYSNTEAMDLLRNAMQIEGPVPGCINIKVARRIGAPSPSPFASPGSNEDDLGIMGGFFAKDVEENNNSLDKSDHVTHSYSDSLDRTEEQNTLDMNDFKSPHLFLDRVKSGNGLRNMSYTRATRDSYMETPEPKKNRENLIDLSKQKPRPHSTIGIGKRPPSGSASSSSEDLNKEPAWLKGPDWTRHASQTSEEAEMSPAGDGFSRDGFGRQSMSEKRKGHADPRSSETYQKAKGLKDLHKGQQRFIQQSGSYGRLVRAGSADSLLSQSSNSLFIPRNGRAMRTVHDKFAVSGIRGPAPPTNLKRFSSLENLSKMHDMDSNNASFDDEDSSPQQPRMVRKRGGNESFRCAVDRSYDPVPQLDMETQKADDGDKGVKLRRSKSVEEEGSEGGSIGHDMTNSARSSVSDNMFSDDKKKGGKKNKDVRRSGGLLKGFFNFRKGRKTPVDDIGKADKPSDGKKDFVDHKDHIDHSTGLWKQAEADQTRSQEEYRKYQQMLDQQRLRPNDSSQQPLHQPFNPFPYKPPEPHSMGLSAPVIGARDINTDSPLTRAEKIQQLRADHRRKHQERQGMYPSEDKEEEYERQIQADEKSAPRLTSDEYFLQKFGQSAIPSQIETGPLGQRSQGPSRNFMERPNSRGAVVDHTQGNSNYKDYQDMQYYGSRHVSDSHITQSNYNRPPSRSQVYPEQQFYGNQSQHQPSHHQPHVLQRGPTPSHDHQVHSGTPRDQIPSSSDSANIQGNYVGNKSNYANYHQVHRGPTPSREVPPRGPTPSRDLYIADKRHYSEDSAFRATEMKNGNLHNNNSHNRDQLTKQDNRAPPGGGNFGISSQAYRDPVYTAMAGKRPVKSISSTPKLAKV